MNQIQFYIYPSQNAFNSVSISYIEPFTRETLSDLIKAHYVKGKILILARVEAIDPFYNDNLSEERSEVVVFYYNAHYLNKLIFRKHGPLNNCYTFRMQCLNPMTQTQIVNISYFAIEPDSMGFDDLAEMEESPLLLNLNMASDLLNQCLEKVENTFVVEKYSVPIKSESFSELPTPVKQPQKTGMYSSDSLTMTEESSDFKVSSISIHSNVVKSEDCLTTPSARMKLNPRLLSCRTQQSLAPTSFSSNQLSLFKKMLRHSADGLSILSMLPSHSRQYQSISPPNIPNFSGGTSKTDDLDQVSNVAVFGPDESAHILSSGSLLSQNRSSNKTDDSNSIRFVTQGANQISIEESSYSFTSFSTDKFSKRASQLKPRLGSVTEEVRLRTTDIDIDSQIGQSSRFLGSESCVFSSSQYSNLSKDLPEASGGFSEGSIYSVVQGLKFKGLFIGTDDDFLQSPIIRLLFQANALACEAAEILPVDIIIEDEAV